MFKVEKTEMTNKTFRIAQNKGVSLNNLVQQCCEYAIKHLDKNTDKL